MFNHALSIGEVFEDHLDKRRKGLPEADRATNYAEDAVLTVNSNAIGYDAIRCSAAKLNERLPSPEFEFLARQVHGRFALLIWRGKSGRQGAIHGADS